MSARPDVPRLSEEELDLLISRSLDGDLSPEEEQQLERLVTLDPAAARRKAELAALVAEVKALPEPAAPFAITTRVSANVAERAGRRGSLGGRVGFFPAPGFAKAALVILAIVGASIAILRPAPKRLAEGPVDVLLFDAPRQAAPEAKNLVADSSVGKADARAKVLAKEKTASDDKEAAPEADERRREAAPAREEVASAEKKAGGKLENARQNEVSAVAQAPVVDQNATKRSDRDEGVALDGFRAQAPAKAANGGTLAAATPAPAAPAPPSAAHAYGQSAGAPGAAPEVRTPRGWTVSVRGDAARRWALRRAPDDPPPARGAAVYRVTLDASGRVTALSRVGATPADPRLDAFVRGMVFEAIPRSAEVQSRLAARDSKDAPAPPADFEIGLEPR